MFFFKCFSTKFESQPKMLPVGHMTYASLTRFKSQEKMPATGIDIQLLDYILHPLTHKSQEPCPIFTFPGGTHKPHLSDRPLHLISPRSLLRRRHQLLKLPNSYPTRLAYQIRLRWTVSPVLRVCKIKSVLPTFIRTA